MNQYEFHPLANIFPQPDTAGCLKAKEIADQGAVYFLRDDERNAIKIGWSTDPLRRLAQIQTGCVGVLRLIGVVAGPLALESGFHELFGDVRIRGEWFNDKEHEITDVVAGLSERGY